MNCQVCRRPTDDNMEVCAWCGAECCPDCILDGLCRDCEQGFNEYCQDEEPDLDD
jgi:hypothetical protein